MKMNGLKLNLDANKNAMTNETSLCPICGSVITNQIINYSSWHDGYLVVVRGVPVRECQANGHRFFQAQVGRSLEKLFKLHQQGQTHPVEMMQVPVLQLEVA